MNPKKQQDGNKEGRKNYNSKKIQHESSWINDPSCSSKDMKETAEAKKHGKKRDEEKEKECHEKVEIKKRKNGEAD